MQFTDWDFTEEDLLHRILKRLSEKVKDFHKASIPFEWVESFPFKTNSILIYNEQGDFIATAHIFINIKETSAHIHINTF